jgi:hypothetical protein
MRIVRSASAKYLETPVTKKFRAPLERGARPGHRNGSMRVFARAGLVVTLAAGAACADPHRERYLASRGEMAARLPPAPRHGPTTVLFDAHLGASYALRRLVVVIDGAVVYNNATPEERPVPRSIFRGRMLPGDHTMQVLAVVTVPCGMTNKPLLSFEVKSAHSFEATQTPRLAIHLFTRGVLEDFDERLELEITEGTAAARLAVVAHESAQAKWSPCDAFGDPDP